MSFSGVLGFLITAALLFNIFFSSKEDFFDAIKHYFTPDFWSIFLGDFSQDHSSEVKLFFWLGISVLMGYGTHQFFN